MSAGNYVRLKYIDVLRGICIMWVVWYHTCHPAFVDYPFFLPALFFISGLCYKQYDWSIFWRKKVNQLLIPFFFFYILYYCFLLLLNYVSKGIIGSDIFYSIFGLFGLYKYNSAFIVNYPLWFVLALLNLQILTFVLCSYIKSNWLLLSLALLITILGNYYIQAIPLPFMIGRALKFYLYFILGIFLNKKYPIGLYDSSNIIRILAVSVLLYFFSFFISKYNNISVIRLLLQYVEISSFIVLLIGGCFFIQRLKISSVFVFYGINSFILLGIHEIYLTVFRIFAEQFSGPLTVPVGLLIFILTLLSSWPTIIYLNKYFPHCVGKKSSIALPL